jgi:hypothetical protein
MSIPKPAAPDAPDDNRAEEAPLAEERGTNEVEHRPDPSADRQPDGETRHIRRSPYTTGND